MAELKVVFGRLGFTNITTLLNSGNVVFFGPTQPLPAMRKTIAAALETEFSFPIPVFICRGESILSLNETQVFGTSGSMKHIKQYVTFLASPLSENSKPPAALCANGFSVLEVKGRMVFSQIDTTTTNTIAAMKVIEQFYGKEVTTRTWNTVKKMQKVLAG